MTRRWSQGPTSLLPADFAVGIGCAGPRLPALAAENLGGAFGDPPSDPLVPNSVAIPRRDCTER